MVCCNSSDFIRNAPALRTASFDGDPKRGYKKMYSIEECLSVRADCLPCNNMSFCSFL